MLEAVSPAVTPDVTMDKPSCLLEGALWVLKQPDPWAKARLTERIVQLWRAGDLEIGAQRAFTPPDRPARRDDIVKLVEPRKVQRLGKGGTLESRQANLHSMAHIESWAVDLSWDIIVRFGQDPSYRLPREFFDDFVRVAEEECKHFCLLTKRLQELGSDYGAFTAHDGLWETATATAHSLPARLAVEHCVHEARGLDVLPATIGKFSKNGDKQTAEMIEGVIYVEEVTHCAAGIRWLRHLHEIAHASSSGASDGSDPAHHDADVGRSQDDDGNGERATAAGAPAAAGDAPHAGGADGAQRLGGVAAAPVDWVAQARRHPRVEEWFHELVRLHFKGSLKAPFNVEARSKAGFEESWYLPLVEDPPARRAPQAQAQA